MKEPFATICGNTFPSKGSLVEECQRLLKKVGPINDLDDHNLLYGIVLRHPAHEEKIGCGIRYFEVRPTKVSPAFRESRGFWIVRTDGTECVFSYKKCVDGHAASLQQEINKACRDAVSETCHARKKIHFGVGDFAPCQESGIQMMWDDAEIHHAGKWPFQRIVDEWLQSLGAAYWRIPLAQDPEFGGVRKFTTKAATDHFRKFHDARAQLQVVHRDVNQRLGSGGYRSTFTPPPKDAANG